MRTGNGSSVIKVLVGLAWAVSFVACTTVTKNNSAESLDEPVEYPQEATDVQPETPAVKRAIHLVLGPGLARGFAHVGVIHALRENGIEIASITGTEMGALVGATAAFARTVNEFDWMLFQFKDSYFTKPKSSLGKFFGQNSKLETLQKTLQTHFGKKLIQDANPKLSIGLFSDGINRFLLVNSGRVSEALEVTLTEPELIPESRWEGLAARTSAPVRPFPVLEIKRDSDLPVVVVDVIGEPQTFDDSQEQERHYQERMIRARSLANDDLNEAQLVIKPQLSDVGYLDFSKRTAAIFQGKVAVSSVLTELKKITEAPSE